MPAFSRDMALNAALRDNPNRPHVGPIMTHGPGRTDNVDMHVRPNSFVIPADVVSAVGEGNSFAGMKVLDRMFKATPYTMKSGGSVGHGKNVPIVAAGGEYVVPPEEVARQGAGDHKRGHSILDEFVRHVRKKNIKTLKSLPGPSRK